MEGHRSLDEPTNRSYRQPLEESCIGDLNISTDDAKSLSKTSNFADLDVLPGGHHSKDKGMILRSRSLDEGMGISSGEADENNGGLEGMELAPSEALHSSFDTALLDNDRDYNSIFRHPSSSKRCGSQKHCCLAWNRLDLDQTDLGAADLSGQKHLRQHAIEATELTHPGTVRKLAKHSTKDSAGTKTPIRADNRMSVSGRNILVGCNNSLSTPSTAKRRSHSNPRKSPFQRTVPPSPGIQRENFAHEYSLLGAPRGTSFMQENTYTNKTTVREFPTILSSTGVKASQATTPKRLDSGGFPMSTMKTFSKGHGTGTTIASSVHLETTLEADRLDTSSLTATPFRFSSFPASLPRVNNARTGGRLCAESVRKRMSFGETSNHPVNQSREDDAGTQNTSISSLSSHGGNQTEKRDNHLLTLADPVHTKLFLDDDEFGYSDDDSTMSPICGLVGRTRLNFNLLLSPQEQSSGCLKDRKSQDDLATIQFDNVDLSRPYEHRKVSSFLSSVSSQTPLRNLSGCDDIATTSTAGLTPSRSGGGSGGGSGSLENARIEHHRPGTPREVQLHFQHMDAGQCSPIPGIPEEDEAACIDQVGGPCRLVLGSDLEFTGSKECGDLGFSTSQNSICSSSSSRMRRLRPMPDMSAFETQVLSPTQNERSSDDSFTLDNKNLSLSPKPLCPPTPVRTPAWANSYSIGHPIYHRSNSLTSTRVLATCSPLVLDGMNPLDHFIEKNEVTNPVLTMPDAASRNMEQKSTKSTPLLLPRHSSGDMGLISSFGTDFEALRVLGSGAFADVYKVRSKRDNRLYAVKRNRRHFRGKRDRDIAMAEVRSMQRLQGICVDGGTKSIKNASFAQYLLFFFRAWQEDGHFFCQTELCCRDTCREMMDSLRSQWNSAKVKYPSFVQSLPALTDVTAGGFMDTTGPLVPESTVWKICHDVCAGLSHIHSHGLVHDDIKPSNIFFVEHETKGALCKIGDFGMAAAIGTSEDGQEGDQKYMAPELLSSGMKHSSADIFSLGLSLYELAAGLNFELPPGGPRWHELRCGFHVPELPSCRSSSIGSLIQGMISPIQEKRPNTDRILKDGNVATARIHCDSFLREYVRSVEEFDKNEERRAEQGNVEEQTPRNAPCRDRVCSPILRNMSTPSGSDLYTPKVQPT